MVRACSSAMHMHLLHTMAEARVVKKRSFDAAESLSTQEEQVSWMKQFLEHVLPTPEVWNNSVQAYSRSSVLYSYFGEPIGLCHSNEHIMYIIIIK